MNNTDSTKRQLDQNNSMLSALMAGASTAAMVGALTYPLDFIKTQQQLNNPITSSKFNIPSNAPSSIAQLFKGGSALVLGSIVKNSARIILYRWLSSFMALETQDSHGNLIKKTTAPRIVIAGIMSGFLETLWIIPFENIKITMIQNMSLHNEIVRTKDAGMKVDVTGYSIPEKHHRPPQNIFNKQYISPHAYFTSELLAQFKGINNSRFSSTHIVKHTKTDALKHKYNQAPNLTFWGTIREIYSINGLRGFTKGSFITIIRQTMISTIWLSSYNWTKQVFLPHNKSHDGWFGDNFTLFQLAGLSILSSAAVIATTQPIDVVKSYLQLKNGLWAYKDSLSTAYLLVVRRGFGVLYKGALPRGLKVLLSGGLSTQFYGYFELLANAANNQTAFSSE